MATPPPPAPQVSTLYVYSKVDALQKISLTAATNDVAFLSDGMAGYLAGGDPAGGAFLGTCDVPSPLSIGAVPIPGATMIRPLPQGNELLALAPPNVFGMAAIVTAPPNPPVGGLGCPSPRGFISISNPPPPAVNLGQGTFVPTQFMISADGAIAYILGETQPPNSARLSFIIVFNIANQTTSSISLSGSAIPLSASLSPAGNLLFVGADDGAVHIIDTSSGSDLQQVTFPAQTPLCFGPGNPPTAVPKTVVAISAVSQNGSNATYSYVVKNSGPPLALGETIVIAGMKDGGNDGTYTILTLGPGSFTVTNTSGVTTTSAQNGSGTVAITCNPDLVAVKP